MKKLAIIVFIMGILLGRGIGMIQEANERREFEQKLDRMVHELQTIEPVEINGDCDIIRISDE